MVPKKVRLSIIVHICSNIEHFSSTIITEIYMTVFYQLQNTVLD